MMPRLLGLTAIVFAMGIFFSSTPAMAQAAQCDFSAVKNSLHATESGSKGYTAVGPQTKYGVPLGKYQFIPPTQAAMLRKCPGGDACQGTKILETQCHQLQECMMNMYLAENLDRVRNNKSCQAALGKTVTGSGQGKKLTCTVTESGLLAAQHLGGPKACGRLAAGAGGVSDNLGTSIAYYACKHGNLPVPGQCTPPKYDPTVQQGVISDYQVDSLDGIGEGDSVNFNVDALNDSWLAALMLMAQQFTANMATQLLSIGQMFDAKHQLETQRLFQQKTAEAHKDYHPSEQMCTFGTFSRDLAATERAAEVTKTAISNSLLQRELGSGDSMAITEVSDSLSRIYKFRKTFCDPNDNSGGLKLLCATTAPQDMRNRDISFTQTLDMPLSLDIDLTDTSTTKDEEAVFALIDNLFLHNPPPRIPEDALEQRKFQYNYMNTRSITAMRGIARNSIANLVALKTATPKDESKDTNAPYLRALMREFGLTNTEIQKMLGENPSYYAQMEFLTKKIYQNPAFYTNLYDKPVNVERIRAAMTAVKLMQDRDIQSALQRREMLLSMILELRLRARSEIVYDTAESAFFKAGSDMMTDPPPVYEDPYEEENP